MVGFGDFELFGGDWGCWGGGSEYFVGVENFYEGFGVRGGGKVLFGESFELILIFCICWMPFLILFYLALCFWEVMTSKLLLNEGRGDKF